MEKRNDGVVRPKNGSHSNKAITPIENVLSRLKNVKKTAKGWTAQCPCHDDKRNSLSISLGNKNQVLLYCFAGCITPNIVGSIDLAFSNLFEEDREKKTKHRQFGKFKGSDIIETYDYTDIKGNLLFQVCRTRDKAFPVRRPIEDQKWAWNLEGVKPVVYHLPEVLRAANRGDDIFIVEGEKDVERLRGAGLSATTSPQGAGKWKAAYDPFFEGANLILIPDNDDPGKKHMLDIADSLLEIAKSVKYINLPNLGEKEDISDWLEKYGTINRLLEITEESVPLPKPEAKNTKEFKEHSELSFADLEGIIKSVTWCWKDWLPAGLLTIVASQPGVGKSALGLRLAASVTMGLPWPDGQPYQGELGSILWCESEAAQAINLQRANEWGLPLEKLALPPLEDPLTQIKLDNKKHRTAIRFMAEKEDIKLIIIDSLRGCHEGDENTSEIINSVMWLAELARDTGKPILLTHHLRKRASHDGDSISLDRVRGSTAIIQPARVIWGIDVPNSDFPDQKRLSVIKSNIGAFPEEPIGFEIDKNGINFGLAPASSKKETQLDRAKGALLFMLRAGSLRANEIYDKFEEIGISKRTVKRAKEDLDIVSDRKEGQWYWSLPKINPLSLELFED